MSQFTIAAAYKWPNKDNKEKTTNSELAIKFITNSLQKRFDNKNNKKIDVKFDVVYKRLRASAGKTMLDSIIKRIETANVVIVDISKLTANVFLELGIALYVSKKQNLSVYIIKEKVGTDELLKDLPSDLQGYFISTYEINNGIPTFKDNNSLLMSIVSDINDFYQNSHGFSEKTDEINFDN